MINEFLENGWDNLGKLSKYNIKNKYSPKKMPEKAQNRADCKNIYSWTHYAPLQWFTHIRKVEDMANQVKKTGKELEFNCCSYCGSPESQTIKHKRCSQCKQRLYCTADCQKYDWKKGHSKECKQLAAKVSTK